MARGRPAIFSNRHPLNVLISHEAYQALRREARVIGQDQPGFSVGDLVRDYIARGLGDRAPKPRTIDTKAERVRQLRGIAKSVLKLAEEL